MDRRGFLGTILTLAAAPAIVRADSLMPVRAVEPRGFWVIDELVPPRILHYSGYEQIEVVTSVPWPPLGETFEELLRRRIAEHKREQAACILRQAELLNRYTGQHS